MSKAGIDVKERNISAHSLRHSLNTHILATGCDPLKARAYLGWSNYLWAPVLTPVQEGYTHLKAQDLRDVVSAIDSIFLTPDP